MNAAIGRRSVIASLGAGAGLSLLGTALGAETTTLRVRREIGDLEKSFPAELDLFRRAVAAMTSSAAGKSAWERNAEIHAAHCGVGPGAEIHRTIRFLPWHRAFLWMTERNLQHAVGSEQVALPYWHWPVARGVPGSFRSGALSHPRANLHLGAADYQYAQAMDSTDRYVGELETVSGRTVVRQIGFGGYPGDFALSALEGTPHGSVHNRIGNDTTAGVQHDMGNIRWSPRDPIFFGHHGNLDRLWEIWRGAAGSKQRGTEPWTDSAFANASFSFFDLSTGLTRPVRLVETRDLAELGYRYAPPGEGPTGSPAAAVAGTRQSTAPVAPDPSELGAPLASGDAALSSGSLGASSGFPAATRAILTIRGISVPRDRGVTVAVYLTRRDVPFKASDAHFAGMTAVVSQPTASTVSVAMDVTAALRATRIDKGKVTVVLVPVGERSGRALAIEGYDIRVTPR